MGGIIRVFSSQLPDHMPTFIYSFCESILSFMGCGNWSGYSCLVYLQHKTTVPLWMKIHQAMKLMPTTTGQSCPSSHALTVLRVAVVMPAINHPTW